MAQSTVTTATASKPIRLTGVLAALLILGVVMFAVPPGSRLAIAAVVIVGALLVRGGDAAKVIDALRVRVYGS